MSLAGITTLQSIQAQAARLELLGSHKSLNSKELKLGEVFKKALDFLFFYAEGEEAFDCRENMGFAWGSSALR